MIYPKSNLGRCKLTPHISGSKSLAVWAPLAHSFVSAVKEQAQALGWHKKLEQQGNVCATNLCSMGFLVTALWLSLQEWCESLQSLGALWFQLEMCKTPTAAFWNEKSF